MIGAPCECGDGYASCNMVPAAYECTQCGRLEPESAAIVMEEITRLRSDNKRLRTALDGIVEYGKLCSDFDELLGERLIYLAKQALNS